MYGNNTAPKIHIEIQVVKIYHSGGLIPNKTPITPPQPMIKCNIRRLNMTSTSSVLSAGVTEKSKPNIGNLTRVACIGFSRFKKASEKSIPVKMEMNTLVINQICFAWVLIKLNIFKIVFFIKILNFL